MSTTASTAPTEPDPPRSHPDDLHHLIPTYLTALQVEVKSPNTIASYRNSLADFLTVAERLSLPTKANELTIEHVYRFLGELRKRGASPAYQHRRHREVKACFSWLRRMGLIEENVFARVPLVKRPEVIKRPFTPEEVRQLLRSQNPERYTGSRNIALLYFLLDTGVRASECVTIELGDVDWEHQRLLIRKAKGDKQRWVGFGPTTEASLQRYIERFRGTEDGAPFQAARGQDMATGHTLAVLLGRLGEQAGVGTVHPHRFRHSFATWAIESGAREIDVQLLLGHSDLTMTHRYAKTYRSEQALQAHAALSPVNRLVG